MSPAINRGARPWPPKVFKMIEAVKNLLSLLIWIVAMFVIIPVILICNLIAGEPWNG